MTPSFKLPLIPPGVVPDAGPAKSADKGKTFSRVIFADGPRGRSRVPEGAGRLPQGKAGREKGRRQSGQKKNRRVRRLVDFLFSVPSYSLLASSSGSEESLPL